LRIYNSKLHQNQKQTLFNILLNSVFYTHTTTYRKTPTFFDKNSRQLIFKPHYLNNYYSTYLSLLGKLFNVFLKPYFTKIQFKGKGYYIYKNYRNTITPQFGYSHRLYLYSYLQYVKFLSKTSLICFGFNPLRNTYVTNTFYKWKPVNIFTGRGVRFSKQIIYKKAGKVSSYR
jgi:ribosomal protein L6P/L9E